MASELPWQPWQWVDDRAVAQLTGRTLKAVQHDRCRGKGIPFKKLNGTTVRYRVADIVAWIEAQPAGGDLLAPAASRRKSPRTVRGAKGA
jgi:hypothetical protein